MSIDSEKYNRILDEYTAKRNRALEEAAKKKEDFLKNHLDVAEIEEQIRHIFVEKAIDSIKQGSYTDNVYTEKIEKLQKIKEELLKRYGVRESCFEPSFECRKCKDTGFVNGERCSCFNKKLIEATYDASHIGDILEEENFENFSLDYYSDQIKDPGTGKTAKECAVGAYKIGWEFVNEFDTRFRNLLIVGGTGVGKTFLSHCIAKEMLDRGKSVIYLTAFKFFDALSAERFNQSSNDGIGRSQIEQCDLLIIDDLGSEMANRFTRTELFAVINERMLNKKPVIISTNLSIHAIIEQYTERVYSRIMDCYEIVNLLGHDIRAQKSMEVI